MRLEQAIMSTVSYIHSNPCGVGHISDVYTDDNPQLINLRLNLFHRCLHKKKAIFLAGDDFIGLYIICSGPVKSFMSYKQRIAKFLVDLSTDFVDRGQSGNELLLIMTRTDIANYLGMAMETVSRILGKFQDKGIIDVYQRIIKINNKKELLSCMYGINFSNIPIVHNSNTKVPHELG